MEDKLEKIKNLGLEIVSKKPRMEATFGEYTDSVLKKVDSTSETGVSILEAHFATLPFSIKQPEYWEKKSKELTIDGRKLFFTPFQFDYLKWNAMLGIKVLPDEIVLNDVLMCLKSDFGVHNEESITEAIKLNLRGYFPSMVESFGQVNRIYISKLLVMYEKKLKDDLKLAYIIRDNLKMEDKSREETDPAFVEKRMKEAINEVFKEFKRIGDVNSVDLISYVIYDFLDKRKILNITPEEKKSLMEEANTRIVLIENAATLKGLVSRLVGYDKDATISMAKRLAVRNYFNTISSLEL